MNRIYIAITVLFSILIVGNRLAQSQPTALGEWKTHLPYNEVIDVAVADDKVYAATPYSMFTYSFIDNRIELFDKIKGLSDVGINKIGYNSLLNSLLVAYSNANLDLIYPDGSVRNISDIKDKDILGNKTINNITFKDEFAYLSCGFGIVVLDMQREEVKDTYYIGPNGNAINVLDLTYNETFFYAATESGVYYADVNSIALADYNSWYKDETLIYPDLKYNLIENFNGKIYTNYYNEGEIRGDTLFVKNGSTWNYFDEGNNSRHYQLNVKYNELIIVNQNLISIVGESGEVDKLIYKVNDKSFQPLACDKDNNDFYWIGSKTQGLIKNWDTWNGEFIRPNGPSTKNVYALDAEGNNVWVAPGGRQADWAKLYMRDGVFSYTDDLWNSLNRFNTAAFDSITDMVSVKVDPQNVNIAYIGTWQEGIMKFVNNELSAIYNEFNSSLQPWVANPKLVNISGLDFDDQHNLWIANTGAPDILSVMKNDGSWRSFNLGGSLSGIDIANLMVDNSNQKWIMKRTDGMVIVFTDNGTIDNPSDDRVKVLSSATGNGNIPGSKVYSFATDMDGEVWVGTDEGVAVFYSPENIFVQGANFDAQQILVPRNDGSGLADILLESETVTAICVNGANQKWMGTSRAGVFLLSEDGTEEIHHFTTENSPLLSDNITGITIKANGEVFIGTANGIISFRGNATPPGPTSDGVYAFPNPVREDYTGPIAITGLENSSNVKITDTYGNVVFATRSEGGTAIWDGYNFNGTQAATGIYLVFIANEDGSEKLATKILVVK
jgi:hypothetical protein